MGREEAAVPAQDQLIREAPSAMWLVGEEPEPQKQGWKRGTDSQHQAAAEVKETGTGDLRIRRPEQKEVSRSSS